MKSSILTLFLFLNVCVANSANLQFHLYNCEGTPLYSLKANEIDSVDWQNRPILPEDTTITYDLSHVIRSTEGSSADVHYVNGTIAKSEIRIFSETGQTQIVYEFVNKQIKVTEKVFEYQKHITNNKVT